MYVHMYFRLNVCTYFAFRSISYNCCLAWRKHFCIVTNTFVCSLLTILQKRCPISTPKIKVTDLQTVPFRLASTTSPASLFFDKSYFSLIMSSPEKRKCHVASVFVAIFIDNPFIAECDNESLFSHLLDKYLIAKGD